MPIRSCHSAFPTSITIGGWLGGALLWHFAAMWVLMANFAAYLAYGLATGRFRRKLWPIRPREIAADIKAALGGRLAHADLAHYNGVQKLLYAGVILLIVLAIVSGFAIWKPVQLAALTAAMGGFQGARIVHFLAMSGIVGFLAGARRHGGSGPKDTARDGARTLSLSGDSDAETDQVPPADSRCRWRPVAARRRPAVGSGKPARDTCAAPPAWDRW